METSEIIMAIFIYFILPVVVIFGTMILLRKKRAGRKADPNDKFKVSDIKDIKEDESKDARRKAESDPSQRTQTGTSNPNEDKNLQE